MKVQKPGHELNVVEVQSAVSNSELRQLTRGKLVVTIASKKKPLELKLEGRVMTRATCEIFQVFQYSYTVKRNQKRKNN